MTAKYRSSSLLAALLFLASMEVFAATPARTLDDFKDISGWTAVASDQITAKLRKDDNALCLDFDFHGVSGYAGVRRALPIDYPDNYEFAFRIRGNAQDNALQFKVADEKNENVWWVNKPEFSFPREWQDIKYKKRQIGFAWGPIADRTLKHSAALEFTIYAGTGGSGEVCFDRLTLREIPPPPATLPKPIAKASSSLGSDKPENAIDGDAKTAWRSDPKRGSEQTFTLDLGTSREFGGLVLHWIGDAFAARYDVELSDDARTWRTVRRVVSGNGGVDPLYLPESEARYVRLALHGPSRSYALGEIEIEDLAFGASANAFFAALAKTAPRGSYPRGFYDEQTYWTVVGIDGGHETGLFSEDGALEVAKGGFSIEPFLIDGDSLASWADVTIAHSLEDGYLPIPSVVWQWKDLKLTTTAFGEGSRDASRLIASYTLENASDAPRKITLALAVRPFQVNPAVQFLNTPGGISPIRDLAFDSDAIRVNGASRAYALETPSSFHASAFDAGMDTDHLRLWSAQTDGSETPAIHDETGLASGALLYAIELPPHASKTIGIEIPLDGATRAPTHTEDATAWIASRKEAASRTWHDTLDRVVLRVPKSAQPLADTLRTALAHILISRDGAALRPGTRSYARSWIRDGAMMSEGLLRLGQNDAAREYLKWYAPYQFKDGKVPCCVDGRGSDPVPENDSHGELIHLAAEVYRYTGDRDLLRAMWPHVQSAIGYMDQLRASERGDTNPAFRGLMPASISHEGYSAKPMHSYWDDFWALTGYKDAVHIATAIGDPGATARISRARDEFHEDLYASIRKSVADHAIDYLPGCAELGDFDATSTTIALSPAGEQSNLPQDLLHNTFERYWKQFAERRDGVKPWKDYTPYEWRTVGTFVRLGWRDRAQQAIDFFLHDRRPAEWNQWAEVVGHDPRESRFVGDMPHGWVASDFIRSALDLFAYERAADQSIVIAGGIPSSWLDGDGIAIEKLRTPYGALSYSLRGDGRVLRLKIEGNGMRVPPGGIVFAGPHNGEIRVRSGGKSVHVRNGELRIDALPVDLTIE